MAAPYPLTDLERDKWILERRPARETLDLRKPSAFFVEDEPTASGEIVPVATIFLTNRECPWRCVMCDLWRKTLTSSLPPGAIPEQIEFAFSQLPAAQILKLYNSGSFFDPRAIPVEDHPAIASLANRFERTIVECHPALIGGNALRFRDRLKGRLEVAMGLETAHPETLARLNKRMTLQQFSTAANFLRANQMDLRVFVLVQPPFMPPEESLPWAKRSLDFAFDCGATAVTLIPTRGGNGAMEALAAENQFAPPSLETLEAAMTYGLALKRGRVFADLWDIDQVRSCRICRGARLAHLRDMNLTQIDATEVFCRSCSLAN
jgi:radical SAM enzyme (TIGR01210 family)